MKPFLWRHRLSWLAAIAVTGIAALVLARAIAETRRSTEASAKTQPPKNSPRFVPANTVSDRNVYYSRIRTVDASKLPDFGKYAIETPTELLLAMGAVPPSTPPAPTFLNPKVEPGKVRWHKDFAAACAAAQKSAKPVLLFQMMGKLDQRFC